MTHRILTLDGVSGYLGMALIGLKPMPARLFKILLLACCVCAATVFFACTPNGIYHTVKPGQTLYRIAQSYQVDAQELAEVNRIKDPRQLRAGQRLYIPGASQALRVPATARQPAPARPAPRRDPQDTTASPSRPAPQSAPAPATPSAPQPVQRAPADQAAKGRFDWPLQGRILNGFGSKGDTARKGIEIAADRGSAVKAAAPGKVIYSGDAIRGYGNLIILEHSDNYFTVYGYNQKNLVGQNEFVGKGDRIALSGSPPNGKSPRLHFEIRRGKQAVDPIFYLP